MIFISKAKCYVTNKINYMISVVNVQHINFIYTSFVVLKELQRMEDVGVIEKQSEPPSWVNSMVTVVKPNNLQICINPANVN